MIASVYQRRGNRTKAQRRQAGNTHPVSIIPGRESTRESVYERERERESVYEREREREREGERERGGENERMFLLYFCISLIIICFCIYMQLCLYLTTCYAL